MAEDINVSYKFFLLESVLQPHTHLHCGAGGCLCCVFCTCPKGFPLALLKVMRIDAEMQRLAAA